MSPYWKKFLITFALTAIVSIGLVIWVILPKYQQVKTNYQSLNTQSQTLGKMDDKLKKLQKLEQDPDLTEIIFLLKTAVPTNEDTGDYIIQLERMAELSLTKINNLSFRATAPAIKQTSESSKEESSATNSTEKTASPSAPTPTVAAETVVNSLGFSISIEGTYDLILKFFGLLERSNRISQLTSLSFGTGQTGMQIKIDGKIFTKGEPTRTSANDSELTINSKALQDKLSGIEHFGESINLPAETGFGRTNPFEGF